MSNSQDFEMQTDPLMDGPMPEGTLRVKLIGVGGAGSNAVDRLKLEQLSQIYLAVVNTDGQALNSSPIDEKLLLGRSVTRGLSSGGEASVGRQAAEADRELLRKMVRGTDLVFLLTGLGGGTGSGAAPIIAELAVEEGATVIAFVTMPFSREGARRMQQAEGALSRLRSSCNAVITLPNDLLLQQIDENATVMEAFAVADNWINQGVRSICSMIFDTGLINVDFATLKGALKMAGGKTLFGTGYARGEDYVSQAILELEQCPLLHLPENRYVKRTDSLIVNLSGGPDLTMAKVNQVMEYVTEKFSCKDSLVLGATIEGGLSQSLRITVLGTTESKPTLKGYAPVPSASLPLMSDKRKEIMLDQKPIPVFTRSKHHDQEEEDYSSSKSLREQAEFSFQREEHNRGFFEKTTENLYEGEDLDIPTYLRRGIRIHLH